MVAKKREGMTEHLFRPSGGSSILEGKFRCCQFGIHGISGPAPHKQRGISAERGGWQDALEANHLTLVSDDNDAVGVGDA